MKYRLRLNNKGCVCVPKKAGKGGFTLIELVVSLFLFILLSLMISSFLTYQNWSRLKLQEMSEVQNVFKVISLRLAQDIRGSQEVYRDGTGTEADPLILEISSTDYIWYFYSGNVLYRGEGDLSDVTVANSLRLSKVYVCKGSTKGYIRGWELSYKGSDGGDAADKSSIRRVEYILKGSYWDRGNESDYYQYQTSAFIRIYS